MDCRQVNSLLDLLMDGTLDDEQRQAMAAHGRECRECAQAIRATQQMKALFAQMEPEIDVPLAVQAKWRGAVRQAAKQRRQRKLLRWCATAAAAVVVLIGVGMTLTLKGTPKQSAASYIVEESSAVPLEAEPMPVANSMREAASGAVVEADGAFEADETSPAVQMESYAVDSAASGQWAPACELALKTDDIEVACDRIRDLAQEYEAVAEIQPAGDGSANAYVEIAAENAGDFLNAVTPMDLEGKAFDLPVMTGSGQVLILLVLHS